MKNTPTHILFEPSGCLSRESLSHFVAGNLNKTEMAVVKAHLKTCEFCAMAAEGLAMADPEEFNQDLEIIFASLKKLEIPEEDLTPEYTGEVEGVGFPGKIDAEMFTSEVHKLEKATDDQSVKKLPIHQKSLFRKYRAEMIAAILLLLLAIGTRQIYVGLSPEKRQSKLARVESEYIDDKEIIQQEIIRSESPGEERLVKRPTPLKPVEISIVSDNQEDISAPGFEPSHKNAGTGMQMQSSIEEEEAEGVEIFAIAEQAPEFPGGDKKRIEFLTENIKYPDQALENGVQGTVYIGFVVEKDGSITDTRVLRGIGKGCEEEAFRAIRMMPKWKPGTQSKQPVRMQVNLPITFTLPK